MKLVKNNREDYIEYDLVVNGSVLGYITCWDMFSSSIEGKYTFRPSKNYTTTIAPTQIFKTSDDASKTAIANIQPLMQQTTSEIKQSKFDLLVNQLKFTNTKKPKNNRKGRGKVQKVEEVLRDSEGKPILDKEGNKIGTGKFKTITHKV